MADDISDLRMFAKLVAAGSLSEAARRLNSSPPAMSRRLAAMETRLGVRLVERGSRRFVLTEEGTLLHDRSLPILAEIDDAEAEATAGVAMPRGHLRVSAPSQIGRRRIAPLVGAFVQRFPKVSIEFVLSDAEPQIAEDGFNVAFTVGPPPEASLVVRRLTPARNLVACAAPAYLERHGTPMRPDDLLRHDCIRLVRGRRLLDHWMFEEDGRHRQIHVTGRLSTTSGEVMHGWALAGLGIALKLRWDIGEELESGKLVACLESYAADERALYIAYASQSHLPPRMRAFIDFSADYIRDLRLLA